MAAAVRLGLAQAFGPAGTHQIGLGGIGGEEGGDHLARLPGGGELFYVSPDGDLMAVPITTKGGAIEVGSAVRLFKAHLRPATRLDAYAYDVARDGRRFLMSTIAEQATPDSLTLVINWPARQGR